MLACRRIDGGVRIGVWDQGAGIPADKLPSVFGEFIRLSEHNSMCHKGMGLGLSIVRGFMEAQRGAVTLVAVPAGTCFRLVLPLVEHDHVPEE